MLVRVVLDGADGSVSLMQAVDALDDITVAGLMLIFVVTGVRILHFVFVLVFGVSL